MFRFFRRMESMLTASFRPITRRFWRLASRVRRAPYFVSRKIIYKIRKLGRSKESKIEDYIAFRQYYFAKRLVFFLCIAFVAVSIFGYVIYDKNFRPYKKFYADEEITYTGKAKIYQSKEVKELLYDGNIKEGSYHEEGKLFYNMPPYSLKYEGEFNNGIFNGEGEYFGIQGHTIYVGTYKSELYEGQGKLYSDDQDNRLIYEGVFKKGLYGGEGTLYSLENLPHYEGEFKNGEYWGEGILYNDGMTTRAYEGSFKKGLFHGKGKKFNLFEQLEGEGGFMNGEYSGKAILYDSEGNVLYDGQMRSGLYHGKGIEYDSRSQTILFEGTFIDGFYDGFGRLSNELGELVYEGGFAKGLYQGYGAAYKQDILSYDGEHVQGSRFGSGRIYDVSGALVYEGESSDGIYDGFGTRYDPLTGDTLFKGYFSQGFGDILLYIGKTEEVILEKLGPPEDTQVMDEGNILLVYQSLGFGLNADYERRTETDMVITGVRIFGDTEVLGVKREMTASIVESILGVPLSRNMISETGLAEEEASIDLLTFKVGRYKLEVPYESSETESQYIAVELLE